MYVAWKRLTAVTLVVTILLGALEIGAEATTAPVAADSTASVSANGYTAYIQQYTDASHPSADIRMEGASYFPQKSTGVQVVESGVLTEEQSTITFPVSVAEAGLYNIEIGYRTVEGNGATIQRELRLDGEIPFKEAENVALSRVFKDSGAGITTDSRGNQFRPEQVEEFVSRSELISDSDGYIPQPLSFYFSAGDHLLTLTSVREPVVIQYVRLYNMAALPTYEQLQQSYTARGYSSASAGNEVIIEAENAVQKSDTNLYPINDRTSSLTQPNDTQKVVLNTIGGYNWRYPHQWMSWNLTVEESGLYQLAMRSKQNFTEGQVSFRTLYIDGQVPFQEAQYLSFDFSYDWQMKVLGNDKPYLFYFEKRPYIYRDLRKYFG